MAELIFTFATPVFAADGTLYQAAAYGEERADGTWAGWLEFAPIDGLRARVRTGQETTQPSRRAMQYWASGIEPVYLEGAFARATAR